jgi:nitrite reductase/ring-hydroxylating ferredoxin subunit
MLSAKQNEELTRVGPGTPMGALLRAYWIPLLYSHELAHNDGAPVRVRLLGESLVAFRDTGGRIGLLDHNCPHRQASLFYGRNEDHGLRCLYHGWQFDVEGRCIDIPGEPEDCPLLGHVRAGAYPCREAEGVIWTFMGKGDPPPLPAMGWARAPAERRTTLKYMRACNWVQAMEGDFDSAHLSFLHRSFDMPPRGEPFAKVEGGDGLRGIVGLDTRPRIEVEDTPVGVMYGARRAGPEGNDYWRVTQFQLPFYTSIPAYNGLNRLKIWVPMDDAHTLVWEANWSSDKALDEEQRQGRRGRVGPSGMLPDTDDWHGRGRFAANASNDYLIDRERQRNVNFSGMEDETPVQDAAMQESMGPIADRTREHLSGSDAAIIRLRQRLLAAAGALARDGTQPPGAADPAIYNAHGEQVLLRQGADWRAAYRAMMAQTYNQS